MVTTAPLLVGLDVGTSSAKAVVYTPEGRPVGAGTAATPWSVTADGVETTAGALIACAVGALADALAAAPDGPVVGLGVTSMGESGILLDRRGEPVGPVVVWHDTRDVEEIEQLQRSPLGQPFPTTTGLPVAGQWSLTKHLWLVRRYPELAAAARRLSVAEWVVRALGGDEAAEQSLASRTGWLNLWTRQWWPETLEWAGARAEQLPGLVTAGTPLGHVTRGRGLDRLRGAVLTVAGHDHQAAAVGAGAHLPGDEFDSCGTAEALVRTIPTGLDPVAVATLARAGITTGWHALAGHWCLLGGTQGGLTLKHTLSSLGRGDTDVAELDAGILAATRADGAGQQGDSRVWCEALRSVAAEAAAVHGAMTDVVGDHRSLVVAGGWSRSAGYLAAKRAALGPFRVSDVAEAGTLGAAWFAGMAAGLQTSASSAQPSEMSDLARKPS